MNSDPNLDASPGPIVATIAAATAAVLGVTAAIVTASARQTELAHPAAGRFVDVSGVRVHYLEEGSGSPLILIHGNAMSSEDFIASGILGSLARRHRVIAFDRPGFGYTNRPRGTDWTPERQAELLHDALVKLDVLDPIVVGHSLGALVAVALAIARPERARALVLLSGYYYPSLPLGLPLFAAAAMPVVGDVMRFTAGPVLGRILEPALTEQMFAPAPVSETFARYPLSMSRRPSQIRATMEDANFMDPATRELEPHYHSLPMPVEILAGDGDIIVDTSKQSKRLAAEVPNARFETVKGAGHMIHYTAPASVLAAIARAESHQRKPAAQADFQIR